MGDESEGGHPENCYVYYETANRQTATTSEELSSRRIYQKQATLNVKATYIEVSLNAPRALEKTTKLSLD